MEKSEKSEKPEKSSADAIALLMADHKEVKKLFKEFEEQKDDPAEARRIAEEACFALRVHAQIEEEVFYPAVRRAIDEPALLDEARVEHEVAKDLIAQLLCLDESDALFAATFTVLSEYVLHHVQEEEGELFPKVEASPLDLMKLGQELAERKEAVETLLSSPEAPPPQSRKESPSTGATRH